MKRNYSTGKADSVFFFNGKEVEKTPAYNMDTLFVVGLHATNDIEQMLAETTYETRHIFFGANHSYKPRSTEEWVDWEKMITYFLEKGYLCSLDIPLAHAEEFHEGGLCSYSNFIPQIRVPLPYIGLWNYNTMIKIDDKGFDATNPGVWCHSLHKLQDRDNFTSWHDYRNDKILK